MQSAFGVDHGEINKSFLGRVGMATGKGVHNAGTKMQRAGAKAGFTGGTTRSWDVPGRKGAAGRKLNQVGQRTSRLGRTLGRNSEATGLGVTALGAGAATGGAVGVKNKVQKPKQPTAFGKAAKPNPFKAFTGAQKPKPAAAKPAWKTPTAPAAPVAPGVSKAFQARQL